MTPQIESQAASRADRQIDPRGPQFNAILASVVLALTLLTAPGTSGIVLLGIQTGLFATAVAFGVQRTPAAYVFKRVVRPRLAAPSHLEDPQPPRFAQAVGLVFAVVGLVGYLSGATLMGAIATGFALAAALLNAVFGFCLGCEIYLLIRRIAPARSTPVPENTNAAPSAGTPADDTKEEEAFA
jgi:predicted lipid-binding transport protein (Tim44 family)